MALLAMLTGIALPAHAYRMHAARGVPGADFCTTAKPVGAAADSIAIFATDAPAPPEHDHGVKCDACCGCGVVAAAPALPRSLPALAAAPALPADLPAAHSPVAAGFALARGPPARS
jgi:hypothetical protein